MVQLDATTAFLSADIEEGVFVGQSRGFETKDKNGSSLVMKLEKNLQGLEHKAPGTGLIPSILSLLRSDLSYSIMLSASSSTTTAVSSSSSHSTWMIFS